jgi:hypothetical protein
MAKLSELATFALSSSILCHSSRKNPKAANYLRRSKRALTKAANSNLSWTLSLLDTGRNGYLSIRPPPAGQPGIRRRTLRPRRGSDFLLNDEAAE